MTIFNSHVSLPEGNVESKRHKNRVGLKRMCSRVSQSWRMGPTKPDQLTMASTAIPTGFCGAHGPWTYLTGELLAKQIAPMLVKLAAINFTIPQENHRFYRWYKLTIPRKLGGL